jgi:hypothetical protein
MRAVRAGLALVALTGAVLPAAAQELTPVTREVTLSGTASFLNGDDDQFRQRHGIPPDFIGGVEQLNMEWMWGEDGSIELEGRGIVDANDWLARLKLERTDKGYVDAGYREFRTWYDGTGGFFPQNAAIFSFFDEDLRLDRGEGWIEAGLRAPNVPRLTFRYAQFSRDGQKSSTSWGDTNLTGGAGTRSIVPSFYDIDEHRRVLDLDVEHAIRGSTVGAGFLYENAEVDNSRNERRTPTEATDRFVTQRDEADSDLYGFHAFTSTPLIDSRLVLSTAYAFSSLDNDLGGSRVYGPDFDSGFDPLFPNRQPFDAGFLDLDGSTELDEHVGTFTLQGRPLETLQVTAGLRAERSEITGASDFVETDVGFPPALPTSQDDMAIKSDADTTGFTESLEVRYTGIENWVGYVRGEWEESDGDLTERQLEVVGATTVLERDTSIEFFGQKYVAGLSWYPLRRVNLAARYWYRDRDYDYDHDLDSTDNSVGANRFPAFMTKQEIETHAGDVRVTWRPVDRVRTTLRYDIAYTDYHQDSDGLDEIESAEVRTHAVGANTTWNPTASSYVQGDFNYVKSSTETPADELTGAAAGLLDDEFDNDYWTGSLVGGLALSERTDIRAQYFYFRADNYGGDATLRQPFGSNAEEHGASLTLAHQVSDTVRWRLGYAYFTNDEEHAGGANDYDASIVTTAVDVKF